MYHLQLMVGLSEPVRGSRFCTEGFGALWCKMTASLLNTLRKIGKKIRKDKNNSWKITKTLREHSAWTPVVPACIGNLATECRRD